MTNFKNLKKLSLQLSSFKEKLSEKKKIESGAFPVVGRGR